MVFPGLIRAGFGSGRDYATCVVHLGPLRASGRSVAACAPAAAGLCGGVALELAGVGELDAPRVISTGIWVRHDLYSMRDPPVRSGSGNGARDGVRGSRGGFARWRSPVCGVPAAGVRYGPRLVAQKKEDDGTVLTEAWNRRGRDAAAPVVRSCGGARRSSVRGRRRASPGSGSPLVPVWSRCEAEQGVRGAHGSPAARNRAAGQLPAAALRGNPDRCRDRSRGPRARGST
jgi:hypothetical protein